jgi:hypothetical protein
MERSSPCAEVQMFSAEDCIFKVPQPFFQDLFTNKDGIRVTLLMTTVYKRPEICFKISQTNLDSTGTRATVPIPVQNPANQQLTKIPNRSLVYQTETLNTDILQIRVSEGSF